MIVQPDLLAQSDPIVNFAERAVKFEVAVFIRNGFIKFDVITVPTHIRPFFDLVLYGDPRLLPPFPLVRSPRTPFLSPE